MIILIGKCNRSIASYKDSFLCDLGNVSGKNRHYNHNSAILTVYNIQRIYLWACYNQSLCVVLQKIVFVVLAVPSYSVPQVTK